MDFFERLQDGVSADEWAGMIIVGVSIVAVVFGLAYVFVKVVGEAIRHRRETRRLAEEPLDTRFYFEQTFDQIERVSEFALPGDVFICTDTGETFIFMKKEGTGV